MLHYETCTNTSEKAILKAVWSVVECERVSDALYLWPNNTLNGGRVRAFCAVWGPSATSVSGLGTFTNNNNKKIALN